MLHINCPNCQQAYTLSDDYLNKRAKCRFCGHVFDIQEPTPASHGAVSGPKETAAAGSPLARHTPTFHDTGPTPHSSGSAPAFGAQRLSLCDREPRRTFGHIVALADSYLFWAKLAIFLGYAAAGFLALAGVLGFLSGLFSDQERTPWWRASTWLFDLPLSILGIAICMVICIVVSRSIAASLRFLAETIYLGVQIESNTNAAADASRLLAQIELIKLDSSG